MIKRKIDKRRKSRNKNKNKKDIKKAHKMSTQEFSAIRKFRK
jgi:hypothetical protein